MMKIAAVIPARGGSIGLPGKNIKPLNGVPLIGRTILAAKQSRYSLDVYVSSDSQEILQAAGQFGAIAIERPLALAGPTASSESALVHALQVIAQRGTPADVLVFLQCTSPFTSAEHINAVVAALLESDAESALSVVEDHGFIWRISEGGEAEGVNHVKHLPRQRRQDLGLNYRETGAVYAMRVPAFLKYENRFCGKTVLVPLDAPTIEIDTMADWSLAEVYAKELENRPGIPINVDRIEALVTDFDGVHTDDLVYVGDDGSERVRCSRSDGMGMENLRKKGVRLLVLSREQNSVVRARAEKLKMEVQHHIIDKLPALDEWRRTNGLDWQTIAYIGNDIHDVECMKACGLSVAPQDAHPDALEVADVILTKRGGHGALRELSDMLINDGRVG